MQTQRVRVNIKETPVVSVDGIADFVLKTGAFQREYGSDAEPVAAWGLRAKAWISRLRSEFGGYLRHAAVVSKYRPGQFRDPEWKADEAHALDNLCVDDSGRKVVIDEPRLLTATMEKNENDATASRAFMEFAERKEQIVLIGATTTSCIAKTFRRLLPQMEAQSIDLQRIIASRDGFASRRSRALDEQRILDELEAHPNIIMVKTLSDICWVLGKKPL